ncbi:ribosomal RNA small subunit methyltransferase G [Mycoplasma sp. CAG:776]|nr:ribosomal RNA small subunit methyltransferase G [Mycoplasma sp. CAG:776]
MNIDTFKKEIAKLNIEITEKNLEDLDIYKEMLLEYNKKFNLTAIKTEEEIYLKHFYDSLTLVKGVDLTKNLKILDIGTGAGFPGLVLKIFYPELEITLLDSNHKKIMFLEQVIKRLNLKNITCLNTRAENLPNNYREYFDIVTSRAVAHLRILSELSIPYLKVNGKLIAMKGISETEIEESEKILTELNSNILEVIKFNLPIEGSNRSLIIVEKEKETDKKYPRSYDKIIKNK